jgi:hypothetical protein
MANGRFISTSIATDKRIASLTLEAEYLFLKTIPHLDRDGLILADSLLLWAKVCPRRPELMERVTDAILQWNEAGLVIYYETDEGNALYFPSFAKNQTGMRYNREAVSKIDPPPGFVRDDSGMFPVKKVDSLSNSGPTPDLLRTNAGPTPAQVQVQVQVQDQVEVEVEEGGRDSDQGITVSAKPAPAPRKPSRNGTHKNFDPRKMKNGMVPPGNGSTPFEVYREVFSASPTKAQIRAMMDTVTDLGKWREVCNTWSLKGYRSNNYAGLLDVYENGWRDDTGGKGSKGRERTGEEIASAWESYVS